MTRNSQFHPIFNFPDLCPLKWLRMTKAKLPIHNFSSLFPTTSTTKVAQNDSEWPIFPDSQLFRSFPNKMAQKAQNSQFAQKWLRMTQNGQFCLIHLSDCFPLKWLRMTENSQFHPICNFSDLFRPKWLRITRNGATFLISAEYQQFCTKPSEQGFFSKLVKMSPRSGMLLSKLMKT